MAGYYRGPRWGDKLLGIFLVALVLVIVLIG